MGWRDLLLFAGAGKTCTMAGVPSAINGARAMVQAMVEPDTVKAGEAAVVGESHVAFLTADGGFTLHEAMSLAGPESARTHAVCDPLVLEGASLFDVCGALVELVLVHGDCGTLLKSRSLLRSSLSKAKGGG